MNDPTRITTQTRAEVLHSINLNMENLSTIKVYPSRLFWKDPVQKEEGKIPSMSGSHHPYRLGTGPPPLSSLLGEVGCQSFSSGVKPQDSYDPCCFPRQIRTIGPVRMSDVSRGTLLGEVCSRSSNSFIFVR